MAEPRDGLTIIARKYRDQASMIAARERVWVYMSARTGDPRRAEPPPFTIGAGLDADSAQGYLVVITPDEHAPEVQILAAELLRGADLPIAEIPDDYIEGLLVRREQMSREGALTRFDARRPSTLHRDGRLEEF